VGIVHRDLKLANIMLSESSTVKVLDFGIAKLVGDVAAGAADAGPRSASRTRPVDAPPRDAEATMALTQTGAMMGTLAYMAPEQWDAKPVDGRTDLWAAGVILYEMVTGEHPLSPLVPGALASVVRRDEPMPSIPERFPDIGKLGRSSTGACLSTRRIGWARPHSPPRYRVNGEVADVTAFAEAFACKEGSPMRPAKVCAVW
jgi:serine/threonine protein kinase